MAEQRTHTAGAYDIRNFIAGLMGIYGVVLTLVGLLGDNESSQAGRGTDLNINLWVGLGLIVFAFGMAAWAKARPTMVDDRQVEADKQK